MGKRVFRNLQCLMAEEIPFNRFPGLRLVKIVRETARMEPPFRT